MSSNTFTPFGGIAIAVATACALIAPALAHDGHHDGPKGGTPVTPASLVQLEGARVVTSRYLDVEAAVADGYVDVGAFVPNMGWHYVNGDLMDDRFDPTRPEILVYADDPCGGKRRLVAVEYAVPLALSKQPPVGFIGRADRWHADEALGLWTLHAWIWEYNPDGVFAAFNPRVP